MQRESTRLRKKKMKVLLVNGSPRRNGNTARALNEVGIVGEDAK